MAARYSDDGDYGRRPVDLGHGAAMSEKLKAAKKAKKDEFYTQLADIEKELGHYKNHFKGKTVYCNCDDPRRSNFVRYFRDNFTALGLKKLFATCYGRAGDLLSNKTTPALKLEYTGSGEVIEPLNGDGDFRSPECIDILKQANIVVTNPPFSLFRPYVAQLMEYGKKFLIIGNMNAVTYKEIFPLIKENKLWCGPSIKSGDRTFGVPDHYPLDAATVWIDENGKKFIKVKSVRWFTNLDHDKRHEELILDRTYTPEDYPTYDNYDAIEVSKTKNIPIDYAGVMGVPISFLDKYNPDQFKILGYCSEWYGAAEKKYEEHIQVSPGGGQKKTTRLNATAVIEIKNPIEKTYYISNCCLYRGTYARILIRNKALQ